MKKQQMQSQYRQLRQSVELSPDFLEELNILRLLETRVSHKAPARHQQEPYDGQN